MQRLHPVEPFGPSRHPHPLGVGQSNTVVLFFLMLHQKAPHREWTPDEGNRKRFATAVIPEPATLFDDYATRPAALPENEQTIARDLTRRDLKLEPPADLVPAWPSVASCR